MKNRSAFPETARTPSQWRACHSFNRECSEFSVIPHELREMVEAEECRVLQNAAHIKICSAATDGVEN